MSKRILSDAERADYRDAKRSEQRELVEAALVRQLPADRVSTAGRYAGRRVQSVAGARPPGPQGRAVNPHSRADGCKGPRRGQR